MVTLRNVRCFLRLLSSAMKWNSLERQVFIFLSVDQPGGIRDGPLEKLWGGEGNFRAEGIFFRYQIPRMNFFQALA